MTRLRGGGPEPNYDRADSSGKSLGDDKESVEQGAVKELRSERQRRLVAGADIRHVLVKERAERDIALLKLKKAQTALKLLQAERAREEAERAEEERVLARREEDVRVHLNEALRMQERMERMLRQESDEHARGLRQELQEESYAKRVVQSRLEKAEAEIAQFSEAHCAEELAVLRAAEKHWRAEWYRQASELADEKNTSLRLNSSLAAEKQKSASIQAELEETVLEAERLQKSASLKAEFEEMEMAWSSKCTRLVSELAIEKQSHAQAIEKQRHLLGVEEKKTSRLEIELARQKNAKQKAEKKLDRAGSG